MEVADTSAILMEAYRPVSDILNDPKWRGRITELVVNRPGEVLLEIAGEGWVEVPRERSSWATPSGIQGICLSLAAQHGIRYSDKMPLLACRTPDGSRWESLLGPNAPLKVQLAIRVKRSVSVEYEAFGLASREADRIRSAMAEGQCVLVSGGTGSGKTTLLNRMVRDIPLDKRIVTVEDTREIEPPHRNWVPILVSRTEADTAVTWPIAIDHVLRMRPDVFLCGELSIVNAFSVLQIMDTGHDAFATTMHANSCLDALRGFRRRVAMGGAGGEAKDVLEQLASLVHLIVQVKRVQEPGRGWVRRVVELKTPGEAIDGHDGPGGTGWRGLIADDQDIDAGMAEEAQGMDGEPDAVDMHRVPDWIVEG